MELLRPTFLVLAGLLGSFAEEDLTGKALIFPVASTSAYVLLKDLSPQPLTSFTMCLSSYTDLTRSYALFSYADKSGTDDILFEKETGNDYSLSVGNQKVVFPVPAQLAPPAGKVHTCVSWESVTGLATLWIDGKPLPRKMIRRGYIIVPEATIVLGQDQDVVGGGFEMTESYVGEVEDFYLWGYVLPAEELCHVKDGRIPPKPVISWRALNYELKGNVLLKKALPAACGLA